MRRFDWPMKGDVAGNWLATSGTQHWVWSLPRDPTNKQNYSQLYTLVLLVAYSLSVEFSELFLWETL